MVKKDMEQENAQNQNNKDNLIKIIKSKVEQVEAHQGGINKMHGEQLLKINQLINQMKSQIADGELHKIVKKNNKKYKKMDGEMLSLRNNNKNKHKDGGILKLKINNKNKCKDGVTANKFNKNNKITGEMNNNQLQE